MHLRDGCRRNRGAEGCEGFSQRLAQRRLDHALSFALRKRRHAILQRLKISRERHAYNIGPRRQELAKLHVGRPEPRERGSDAIAGSLFARGPLDKPRQRKRCASRKRQPARIDRSERALACKHETRTRHPGQVREGCDHSRQPE
jgi:hypothetical protein